MEFDRECLYDRKRDCIIKTYDVIAQLFDARATGPFPFPAPKKKKVKGRQHQTRVGVANISRSLPRLWFYCPGEARC
jgi:hypothetical protein